MESEVLMPPTSAKADVAWVRVFREKFDPWFREARPLIEAHQYQVAFKNYPFVSFDQPLWSPVKVPLAKGCLGLVSTAAIYRKGVDAPFADTPEGDPQIIELPSDVNLQALDTSHTHIPQEPIRADGNVALPLAHLRALVKEGKIAKLARRFFSILGYRICADEVALETAPRIAAAMREDGVTHALVVPV
jgi:hypothetical protein